MILNIRFFSFLSVALFSVFSGCKDRDFHESKGNAVVKGPNTSELWRNQETGNFNNRLNFAFGNQKVFSLNFNSKKHGVLQCYYIIQPTTKIPATNGTDLTGTLDFPLAEATPINKSYVYRDRFYAAMQKQVPGENFALYGDYALIGASFAVGTAVQLALAPVIISAGAVSEGAVAAIEAVEDVSKSNDPTLVNKIVSGCEFSLYLSAVQSLSMSVI